MKKTLPDNVYNLLKGSISADIKNGKATFSEHALIDGED